MILVLLVISACVIAIIGYWSSQVVIGGKGDFDPFQAFTSYLWGKNDANITLVIKNTVSSTLTISNVQLDGNTATYKINGTSQGSLLMPEGSSAEIVITYAFVSGTQYNFIVVTAKGNQFGPYTLAAP